MQRKPENWLRGASHRFGRKLHSRISLSVSTLLRSRGSPPVALSSHRRILLHRAKGTQKRLPRILRNAVDKDEPRGQGERESFAFLRNVLGLLSRATVESAESGGKLSRISRDRKLLVSMSRGHGLLADSRPAFPERRTFGNSLSHIPLTMQITEGAIISRETRGSCHRFSNVTAKRRRPRDSRLRCDAL